MAFVNDKAIPEPTNKYVCFIDAMGTKRQMSVSVHTSAISIFRLHTAIFASSKNETGIQVYPVMDGAYITATETNNLLNVLRRINSDLATDFCNGLCKFLIRSSVAFGPVIHGECVETSTDECINNDFRGDQDFIDYTNKLLIGLPMIQAFEGEKQAPPFGVFIHESARAFAPHEKKPPFTCKWWKWWSWQPHNCERIKWTDDNIKDFAHALEEYFENCKKKPNELDYPKEKIEQHQELMREYFEL